VPQGLLPRIADDYIYKSHASSLLRQFIYDKKAIAIKKNVREKKEKEREITTFVFMIYLAFAQR